MKFSIVTTMYYSAPYLREFYNRMSITVQRLSNDYELIFVNDGSPDNSLEVVLELQKTDSRITIIDLSKNFGHHKAIMAGLSFAHGDFVFLIDCDLEEDPENLDLFFKTILEETDIDVVYGTQPNRKGKPLNKLFSRLFYKVLNLLSNEEFDADMVFSRLMSQRYVESLLQFKESELFLVGLWKITGYNQKAVIISTYHKGESSYSIQKKIALAINAITSFSNKPLVYIAYIGATISFGAIFYTIYLIFKKIFFRQILSGWTSVMVSIWLIGGLIIFFMGIIGIYMSKIFIEIKHRPNIIIKNEYRHKRTDIISKGNDQIQIERL